MSLALRVLMSVLGVAALVIGGMVAFWGSIAIGICSDPGGCRTLPFWPAVAGGLALAVGGIAALASASRIHAASEE